MEFKSRIARGLPVVVLVASLLIPLKPVAAAPYTAKPVAPAVPTAQMAAGTVVADTEELDAAGKYRNPGHGKKRLLVAAVADDLLAAGRTIKHRRTKGTLLAAVSDDLLAAGRIIRHRRTKGTQLAAVSDDLFAVGRPKKRRL
jgi:hypothetical protein